MGLIYKELRIEGDQGARDARILFDTGASRCFIKREIAEAIGTINKTSISLRFATATGIEETDEIVFAHVWLNGHPLHWMFIVVPDLSEEVILGVDFFQVWKIRLDPEQENITIDPNALKLKLV